MAKIIYRGKTSSKAGKKHYLHSLLNIGEGPVHTGIPDLLLAAYFKPKIAELKS